MMMVPNSSGSEPDPLELTRRKLETMEGKSWSSGMTGPPQVVQREGRTELDGGLARNKG